MEKIFYARQELYVHLRCLLEIALNKTGSRNSPGDKSGSEKLPFNEEWNVDVVHYLSVRGDFLIGDS